MAALIATSSSAISRAQRAGGRRARRLGQRGQRGAHAVERPAQIDRGRPRAREPPDRMIERRVVGACVHRNGEAPGRRRADQRRAAHLHVGDGARGLLEIRQAGDDEFMRQARLVDDLDRRAVVDGPDRATRGKQRVARLERGARVVGGRLQLAVGGLALFDRLLDAAANLLLKTARLLNDGLHGFVDVGGHLFDRLGGGFGRLGGGLGRLRSGRLRARHGETPQKRKITSSG
jgi:hypothetical protein